MHVSNGDTKVVWLADNEAPDLLRFEVLARLADGRWAAYQHGQQFTLMPGAAHPFVQWAGLEAILRDVEKSFKAGRDSQSACVRMSWLSASDIDLKKLSRARRQTAWSPLNRPLTIADFEALERGQVVRLWYSCTNTGDFLWEHDHVENGRVFGRFIYQEMEQWSTLDDFLYEFAGSVCRGSGAEPVWNRKPPKYRGC